MKDNKQINNTSKKTYFNINLLNQYINALLVNVNNKHTPNHVNLIFDSGAVNGLLGIGAALYIHHLQKKKIIKINKVSGCSIGSIIAVWYLCDCPEIIYDYLDELFTYYKEHKNFFIFEKIIRKSIYKLFTNDDLSRLDDILYINYYDTTLHKEEVISKFENREHLIECIIRSSHIPFISNNVFKYKDRYIDGISPYIFDTSVTKIDNKHCKNIFIKLIDLHNPLKSINVKNEKNIYTRLLKGVTDTNEFFINNNRTLCMYTNCVIKSQLYIRRLFVLFIVLIIDYIIIFNNNLPICIKHCVLYTSLIDVGKRTWEYLLNMLV